MRFAWVRPGGGRIPDLWKAQRWGLERLIFDANDPQVDAKLLDDIRLGRVGPPCGVGITRSPDWDNHQYAAPLAFAQKLSDDLVRLGFGPATAPHTCLALANREYPHDAADQLAMLKEFRRLRVTRYFAWAVEGHQAGWFSPELRAFIQTTPNFWVIGECYQGDMYPQSERWVIDDLRDVGQVPRDRAKAYYGYPRDTTLGNVGQEILLPPQGWDGILYDFAKLPPNNSHGV